MAGQPRVKISDFWRARLRRELAGVLLQDRILLQQIRIANSVLGGQSLVFVILARL